jgi:short-subunit dehydrogenase
MPVALITGASTGIGRDLAFIAAADGYDVILVARTAASLQAVATEIAGKTSRKAHVFPVDLAEPNAAKVLFTQIEQAGITVDVLINNAGFGLLGKFWELPEDQQMQMVQLNIGALTRLTRLFLPGMIERRSGYIMNLGSTAAFQPGPLMAIYFASKAYVVSFSEAIHNEAKEYGVKVCCLCPGATRTEFDKRAGMEGTKLFREGSRIMSSKEVAQIGWTAMKQGKSSVVAGRMNALLAFSTRFAPRQMTAGIARALQEKK